MKRRPTPHTGWCARDHRCNLGEHRAEDIVIDLPGHGRAALTRVRTDSGDHAEIRLRLALAGSDTAARRQLAVILTDLRALVTRAALAARPAPRRTG
nr:hypothetical protein [Micromonospora sp. DSM 115978]